MCSQEGSKCQSVKGIATINTDRTKLLSYLYCILVHSTKHRHICISPLGPGASAEPVAKCLETGLKCSPRQSVIIQRKRMVLMLGTFIVGENTEIMRLDNRYRIQRGVSRRGEGVAGFVCFCFV